MLRPKLPVIKEPTEYPPLEYDVLAADVKDAPFLTTVAGLIRWSRTLATGLAAASLLMLIMLLLEVASLTRPKRLSTEVTGTLLGMAANAVMIFLNVFLLFKIFRYATELQRAIRLNTRLEDLEVPFKTAIAIQKINFAAALATSVYAMMIILAQLI